jgi:hypothetical protein
MSTKAVRISIDGVFRTFNLTTVEINRLLNGELCNRIIFVCTKVVKKFFISCATMCFIDRSFAAELVERSRNDAVPTDSSSIVAAGKSTISDLNSTTVSAENSNLKCGQGEHTGLHGHNGNNVGSDRGYGGDRGGSIVKAGSEYLTWPLRYGSSACSERK